LSSSSKTAPGSPPVREHDVTAVATRP
jgi:hypothetical protein